ILSSLAECALAICTDCSAMSLLATAICARRTASRVRLRWSCIGNPLQLPLNGTPLLQDRPVRGEGGLGRACRISGTGLPIPACLREKIFFWAVPETRISRRIRGERSAPAPESGTFALRVLWTLSQAHQNFLFHEVRGLCRHYLRSKPEDASEISSEELVSEVWAKLIGRITMPDPDDAADRSNFPDPSGWTIDPQVPENDGRVVWLIREIGGSRALAHRCEDIRRRRWGRATPGVGRPLVQ